MRTGPIVAALLLLALSSGAVAVSIGDVSTTPDPAYMVLDPSKHLQRQDGTPPERQFVDIHVEAEIECALPTSPPLPLKIEAAGDVNHTVTYTGSGESFTFFKVEPTEFTLQWTSQGDGRYTVDHTRTITILSDGASPIDINATVTWESALAEDQGTTRCDPQGYGWVADAMEHVVFLPGYTTKGGDDPIDDEGSEDTPVPVTLALGALVIAGLVRRRKA